MKKYLNDRTLMWYVAVGLIAAAIAPTALLLLVSLACSIWCATLPQEGDDDHEVS